MIGCIGMRILCFEKAPPQYSPHICSKNTLPNQKRLYLYLKIGQMILNLLKRVTQALDEANILYMVSGSMALITYTVPRMTRDIVVVIELSANEIDRFCNIFKSGYYIDTETVAEEVKAGHV